MAPASPTQDHYAILEVLPSADHDQIKISYRRLARLHHPDKNGGSRDSTIKIQRIITAWEVLGDSCKRKEYDRTRAATGSSNSYHPNASKPTSTPQPDRPRPSQPDPTPQEEARAREESQKKRQEWLNFERTQEESIRQSKKLVKNLEATMTALKTKIQENKTKLENDIPYRWNLFAAFSTRLSETEKDDLRRQILDAEVAMRIKQWPLDREKLRLKVLEEELVKRRTREDARLAAELKEEERKERVAKEKAEAQAQRRRAEEAARQYAAWEAKEKAEREERAKAEAARLRRMAEERAKREAEAKKLQEERERMARAEAARLRKVAEERAKREAEMKKLQEEMEKKRQEKIKAAQAAQAERQREHKIFMQQWANVFREEENTWEGRARTCLHKRWWSEVTGPVTCAHCMRPRLRFAFECPDCETTACVSCRRTLKAGGTPEVYHDNDNKNNKNNKNNNRNRQTNTQSRRHRAPSSFDIDEDYFY